MLSLNLTGMLHMDKQVLQGIGPSYNNREYCRNADVQFSGIFCTALSQNVQIYQKVGGAPGFSHLNIYVQRLLDFSYYIIEGSKRPIRREVGNPAQKHHLIKLKYLETIKTRKHFDIHDTCQFGICFLYAPSLALYFTWLLCFCQCGSSKFLWMFCVHKHVHTVGNNSTNCSQWTSWSSSLNQ